MKADSVNMYFLRKSQLIVPYFQRRYIWKEDNWKQLYESLYEDKDCFLGTIVLQKYPNDMSGIENKLSIIDGQQRLMTLSLLYKACTVVDSSIANTEELIYDEGTGDLEDRLRIIPSELDRDDYLDIMKSDGSGPLESKGSKMKAAYNYFLDRLKKKKGVIETIQKRLCDDKEQIFVIISLSAGINSQKIFDTLNNAGVTLSDSESIKNILFEKLLESDPGNKTLIDSVHKRYDATWKRTFERDQIIHDFWKGKVVKGKSYLRTRDDDLVHWVAIIKNMYDPEKHVLKDLCHLYRKFTLENDIESVNALIDDICQYASIFYERCRNLEKDIGYRNKEKFDIFVITALTGYVYMPYILKILREGDAQEQLDVLCTYVVLAKITNSRFKNANKQVALMITGAKTPSDYLQSMIEESALSIASTIESLRHIEDNSLAKILLFSIELHRRYKTPLGDYSELDDRFTLEHIMPKKWMENWGIYKLDVYEDGHIVKDEERAHQIRSLAIFELGNFGLINGKMNASISNSDFKTKVMGTGNNGLAHLSDLRVVRFDVVRDVYEADIPWDERVITTRTKKLAYELFDAFQIRKYLPEKTHHFEQTTLDMDGTASVDLFSVSNYRKTFTGAKLKSYSIDGIEYTIKNSRDFTIKLIERINDDYGDMIKELASDGSINYLESEDKGGYTKISDGVYIDQTHIGLEENTRLIRTIYERLGITDSKIIIKYVPKRMTKD